MANKLLACLLVRCYSNSYDFNALSHDMCDWKMQNICCESSITKVQQPLASVSHSDYSALMLLSSLCYNGFNDKPKCPTHLSAFWFFVVHFSTDIWCIMSWNVIKMLVTKSREKVIKIDLCSPGTQGQWLNQCEQLEAAAVWLLNSWFRLDMSLMLICNNLNAHTLVSDLAINNDNWPRLLP